MPKNYQRIKMKKSFIALGLVSILSLGAAEFLIDAPHSSVGFKAKHLLVSNVYGGFDKFKGKVDIDVESKKVNVFEGELVISSINTKNDARDKHLKSPDFFDAQKYPVGLFKMTKQEGNKLYGDLTLRGVSKPIVLDMEMSDAIEHPKTKKQIVGMELKGKVARKDFGIGDTFLGSVISEEIEININLELNKK